MPSVIRSAPHESSVALASSLANQIHFRILRTAAMTNEHQSVERLLEAALALPPEERGSFLDHACTGDWQLHHLMEQLLEADGIPDSFLRTPVFGDLNDQSSTPNSPLPRSLEEPPRFGVEQVIAGRFKVVRFIARGGMGEVYEVQDQFLQDTRVALKIIRPHIAADPYSARRFEQEVILARKVNHHNLCPIYDIFRCEQPDPPFLFLTMKLIAGESLETRLRRHESIPLDEGVAICNQLIEGIGAIHSVGIIHRDIKPNNVMLERVDDETCVTIMDFGLARLNDLGVSLTKTGIVAGTPGYLAPELMQSSSPSHASDLYALGVVLHQVLAGHRPSPSRSGRAVIVSTDLQTSRVPTALLQAITEFLSEDPERRCIAFERITRQKDGWIKPLKSTLLTRRNFAISGAAAISFLGVGSFWKRHEIDNFLHPLPTKRFVALLNWPPPTDAKVTPMLLGLIDTMVNALSRAEALDHNFYVACQSSLTEMKTPKQVDDVCELLGANLILATSGSINAGEILLVLQVISKDSSKVLRSRSLQVSQGEQFTLPLLATRAAAQLLNVTSLPVNLLPNQLDSRSSEALAAFQAAEALLKEPNYMGVDAAIEQFKLAVDADPRFANAHARLSIAYFQHYAVHHDAAALLLARANAEKALTLDSDSIEGHSALAAVCEATGDLPGALREIANALAPDPSNTRIAVYQAQTYFAARRWQDAEDCFKRVLKARPNYWYAYNELANNYSYQGKYKLAVNAYEAASIASPRRVLPIVGTALMFFFLGDLDRADAAIFRSLSLAPLSIAHQIHADILFVRNRLTESLRAAVQATTLGPQDSTAWLKLADIYARMKRDKEASEGYKRALASVRDDLEVDANDGSSWMLLALFQCKIGDRAAAKLSLQKAEDKNTIDIYSLMNKVRILKLLGRKEEALAALDICINMGATATQIRATKDLEDLDHDLHYSSLIRSTSGNQC